MPHPITPLRLPLEEKERWKAEAAARGLSLTAFIREVVNAQLGGEPVRVASEVKAREPRRGLRSQMCIHRVPAGQFCKRCD